MLPQLAPKGAVAEGLPAFLSFQPGVLEGMNPSTCWSLNTDLE